MDYSTVDFVLAGLFGLAVGLGELVARYKDAPTKALWTLPAALYLGLNAAAAVGALVLIDQLDLGRAIGDEAAVGDEADLHLMPVLVAGTAAMAFFRSSFFNVRVGDADLAVGPSTFLQIVLDAADRGVDRVRAEARSREVLEAMRGVSFEKAHVALPALCLDLMQNLTVDEQGALGEELRELNGAPLREEVKTLLLGLKLMNLVGKGVLLGAVESARQHLLGVAAVAVVPERLELRPGGSARVRAAASDATGGELPTPTAWATSDEAVVTVDASGRAVGVGPGHATLSATADGVSAYVDVVVSGPDA